jgi:predicted transcriptional regulator
MARSDDALLPLAARIVIAQVENNDIPGPALSDLIRDVYQALASVRSGTPSPAARKTPAGQTIFDDHLICRECGMHMKMLKRHLQTVHNVTPKQFRSKWHLPRDYPMVARRYAALRSSLAKRSGLGKRPASRGR